MRTQQIANSATKTMILMRDSFTGWARMDRSENEEICLVDTALTVIGTLLVATTWALIH